MLRAAAGLVADRLWWTDRPGFRHDRNPKGPERQDSITRGVSAGRYYVRVYPYSGRSSQAYRLTAAWGGPIQAEEPAPVDWGKPPVEAP